MGEAIERTRRIARRARPRHLLVAALVALAACSPAPVNPPPTPEVVPSASSPLPSLTAAEIAEAQRFRSDFGLRSDEAWIRLVASDPASAGGEAQWGVPLTPDEVRELEGRIRTTEAIKSVVVPYGEQHPEDWAGAWTDHDAGGRFIAQFSDDIEQHRRHLYGLVSPDANFEVRLVARSLDDLRAMARVLDDPAQRQWFEGIPAALKGYGPLIAANRLGVTLSTVHPDAQALVAEHFGWGDAVQVEADGTGALLLESGSLAIVVRDRQAKPVPGLVCRAVSDLPGAYEPPLPIPTTDAGGRCTLDLPATGFWIEIADRDGRVVSLARASVSPGGASSITVTLEEG